MKPAGQCPEAASWEGSAPPLEQAGPARGAGRARHFPGFSPGNRFFPWKNGRGLAAPAAPSRREHPPRGPGQRRSAPAPRGRAGGGPGHSAGEAAALPHRCGGETPPWPRSGRRPFPVPAAAAAPSPARLRLHRAGWAGPGGAPAVGPEPLEPRGRERPCRAGGEGVERSPEQQGQGRVGASPEAATELVRGRQERMRELGLG